MNTIPPEPAAVGRADGPAPDDRDQADRRVALPVVEEDLLVGTRWVDAGGVRLRKRVHGDTVTVDVPLRVDSVGVQRVPVGREVEAPVDVRWEGDVMIVPVLEERLVVRKQLVLVEELRVTRRVQTRHAPQDVSTRREEVVVERLEALSPSPSSPLSSSQAPAAP